MNEHRSGTERVDDAADSAVDIQDTPHEDAHHRAELVDGPAGGEFRPLQLEPQGPPAELDVEVGDGLHAAYVYFGRRGEADPTAYAYGWDRQQPTTSRIS